MVNKSCTGSSSETRRNIESKYKCNQAKTIPINFNLREPFTASDEVGGITKQCEMYYRHHTTR